MELARLASNIFVDLDTLKNICVSNELDFTKIEEQVKIELYWNSLIFEIYKNNLNINQTEIEDRLKLAQNKKKIEEYLISEIVIKTVEKDKLESVIRELKNKIKIEGFESVAISLSISDSASRGGNLGWLKENLISKKLLSILANTPLGNISEPILLPRGILIFKVRNKRKIKIEKNIIIEETKEVNSEKTKILNMHSSAHYNNIRSSVSVKFF